MGLLTCPDCENRVSDQADSCIHCGRPIARLDGGAESADEREQTRRENQEGAGRNYIDDGPQGLSRRGRIIMAVGVTGGAGIGALVGGIWGFMTFAVIVLVTVFAAYS